MNLEILPEIRNKLTAPKIALEKITRNEKMSKEFFELAPRETIIASGKESFFS